MDRREVRIRGVKGIPEILPGTDLATVILAALEAAGTGADAMPADPAVPSVFVIAQKIVSKSENSLVRLESVIPSPAAQMWASKYHRDPRVMEVIMQQARRIVRMDRGIIITETHHGFICANAGVDTSNAPPGTVVLLPRDPDGSADRLRSGLERALHRRIAVIISDTFGRPWRNGLTNVAIGISGLSPFIDYRGTPDSWGRPLSASMLAVADELAGAAELVMGKTSAIPVAVIEGFRYTTAEGKGRELVRPAEEDLFR